jgi:uncharacterized iron-regulated membrane protein
MSYWQRWLKAPHTLTLRKFLFQVHLWFGIGLGLYVLLISVSGSVFILNPLIHGWFVPSTVNVDTAQALRGTALDTRLTTVYSDFEITDVMASSDPATAVYVTLRKDGVESTRFFDQYQGEDLGSAIPWQVNVSEWIINFHTDLLLGRSGRRINGLGGLLFLVMMLSGVLIWWQGKAGWYQGMLIKMRSPRGILWQLHSAVGFWVLLLLFMWGLSGFYFVYPQFFNALIDAIDLNMEDESRPDALLRFVSSLHRARYDADWLRILWATLGLLPALLFVSGFVLWWRRVVGKLLK